MSEKNLLWIILAPGAAGPWASAMTYPNTSVPPANISGGLDGLDSGGNIYRPFSVFSVLTLTLLAMLVVATFVWNLLVLVTILRVRTFHRVPHNLVASMAISDVMVAALVMPLSLVHELNGRLWKLGRVLCQVWISFDVLCCTASIWNVTAIALDRYWSITRHLQYTLKTRKKISNVMIALTWLLSSIISLSPLFGWGETYSEGMKCQVSQEPSYTIFSTFGAFYLPLCVVLFVYWKIYKAAKFRIGSRKTNTITPMAEVIIFFSLCDPFSQNNPAFFDSFILLEGSRAIMSRKWSWKVRGQDVDTAVITLIYHMFWLQINCIGQ